MCRRFTVKAYAHLAHQYAKRQLSGFERGIHRARLPHGMVMDLKRIVIGEESPRKDLPGIRDLAYTDSHDRAKC